MKNDGEKNQDGAAMQPGESNELSEKEKRARVERYLSHLRSLNIRIKSLQDQIEHHRALLEPTAVRYGDKVSHSAAEDAMERSVIKLQSLIEEYASELSSFVEEQRTAYHVFKKLSRAEYGAALSGYYVCGNSWEQVCAEIQYSWPGVMKLRRKAVLEIYDLMPEGWQETDDLRLLKPDTQRHINC